MAADPGQPPEEPLQDGGGQDGGGQDGGGPGGVKELRLIDLKRLGINSRQQLFWDGKRVEVRQRFDLTGWQRLAAILVTLFALLGGIGGFFSGAADAAAFLCARNLHWLSCPLPPR